MAANKAASVKVAGLDDLRKELKKLDDTGLIDGLKNANYQVASMVVTRARTKAVALGAMERKAADSLKASLTAARAQVSGGGANTPFFGGAEFGAGQNQIRNTTAGLMTGWNQFEPWTGSNSGSGRFLFPTIRASVDEIVDMYFDAIGKLTADAFPD